MSQVLSSPKIKSIEKLRQRIQSLAAKAKPKKLPRGTGKETLEELEIREAEAAYSRALARLVWARLSTRERAMMHVEVCSLNTTYLDHPENRWSEMECFRLIRGVLEE